jgi:hypothetical protein
VKSELECVHSDFRPSASYPERSYFDLHVPLYFSEPQSGRDFDQQAADLTSSTTTLPSSNPSSYILYMSLIAAAVLLAVAATAAACVLRRKRSPPGPPHHHPPPVSHPTAVLPYGDGHVSQTNGHRFRAGHHAGHRRDVVAAAGGAGMPLLGGEGGLVAVQGFGPLAGSESNSSSGKGHLGYHHQQQQSVNNGQPTQHVFKPQVNQQVFLYPEP